MLHLDLQGIPGYARTTRTRAGGRPPDGAIARNGAGLLCQKCPRAVTYDAFKRPGALRGRAASRRLAGRLGTADGPLQSPAADRRVAPLHAKVLRMRSS